MQPVIDQPTRDRALALLCALEPLPIGGQPAAVAAIESARIRAPALFARILASRPTQAWQLYLNGLLSLAAGQPGRHAADLLQLVGQPAIAAPTLHRNGTVSYWDPLHCIWRRRQQQVPEYAICVLPRPLRDQVERHLSKARLCA